MDERLERETEGLVKSWSRHDEPWLRDYLVSDVEDPRINVQSVLTRHFLIEALLGNRFAAFMEHELRFAAAANWLSAVLKKPGGVEEFPALLCALQRGADNAEGLPIPHFISQTFAMLPARAGELAVPHYLNDWLITAASESVTARIGDEALATFQRIWGTVLGKESSRGITVLEPACGSANDYRFLDAFGIAPLVDYTGFDLCESNVRNARALFPGTHFEVGNVFKCPAADKSFHLCFVHDLFEHLSIAGLEAAIDEICRVTREGICVGFFSMHEDEEHIVRPVADYHWNTLSLARTAALFERHGFGVEPIHIGTFLKWKLGCEETHNGNAYTFFGTLH